MTADEKAHRLVTLLSEHGLTAATCESLTAGLVAATITTVPGASAVFRGGLVTYASDLKNTLAGVDARWIAQNGVINSITAAQMTLGCRKVCGADVGMACTGVAGPDPQDGEQAGTVFIAVVYRGAPVVRHLQLEGSREEIRRGTVERLLDLGCEAVLGSGD
ncbi:CinA family protein [Cutibacterium modestum]|uniref:CinA family protein n=1 Tax=Cutibacterium modestum TaxID=2559073 RepID=UPI000F07206E|nr:CinA family protein [Cutibacterium modestum]MCP2378392.1 competence/damage-inducible protein CinA C-terminal domain-containing protein [Cutibacterium modestum 31N]